MFCGECGAAARQSAGEPARAAVPSVDPEGGRVASDGRPPAAVPVPVPVHTPMSVQTSVAEETEDRTPGRRFPSNAPSAASYVLQFSTGEVVIVTGGVLIGRNPVPQPGEVFDELVSIHDPAKSVSKTHLEVGVENGQLWANDRYSGNGTVLRRGDGTAERCNPGKRYRVLRGERLELGEQFLLVS